ncbi:HdeD family acid-resistance protein [Desulfobacterota bacterium AH_259_B03_O07]|nr:HdeD family acid-resistance protein [Desulfobacterota bacterium AH_259_B03_O07]
MKRLLAEFWWAFVLRGILAVIFGIAAIMWPGKTLQLLLFIIGIYFFADGIVIMFTAFNNKDDWWMLFIEGIISMLFGIVIFFLPGITALILLYLVAMWALFTGLFELITVFRLPKGHSAFRFLVVMGILSVLLAILLIVFPGEGAVAAIWLIGIYAILFGISTVIFGLKLRSFEDQLDTQNQK